MDQDKNNKKPYFQRDNSPRSCIKCGGSGKMRFPSDMGGWHYETCFYCKGSGLKSTSKSA